MKIPNQVKTEATTYELLIGMIEGCMPNDDDMVTTEKLLDKLLLEYAQHFRKNPLTPMQEAIEALKYNNHNH